MWKRALSLICLLTVFGQLISGSINAAPDESEQLLAQARDKLERYENTILHSFLARYSLGADAQTDDDETAFLFKSVRSAPPHLRQMDEKSEREIAQSEATRNFTSPRPYPPALSYVLPEALQQAGAHQAANATDILAFYHNALATDLNNVTLHDDTAAGLFNAVILKAVSSRVLLGRDVAWAKFIAQPAVFCQLIRAKDTGQIRTMLTNQKQVTTVLDRVADKVDTWTKLGPGASIRYPDHTRTTILALFQAYLIPITTQLEVQTIMSYAREC